MYTTQSFVLLLALATGLVHAWPQRRYKTEPFHPPVFLVKKSGKSLAPGFIFFAPTPQSSSAYIMTDDGELVWSTIIGNLANFAIQQLHGEDVLVIWNGTGSPGFGTVSHGYGQVQILDSHYDNIFTVCPDYNLVANGIDLEGACQADVHDAFITPQGTLLTTAYNLTMADLTSVGGNSSGYIWDSQFYEVDIETNKVLFRWSSVEAGVAMSESFQPLLNTGTYASPFDFFHINSLQGLPDGYLVNSRQCWTVYFIDKKGEIKWRFNGNDGGDFTLPEGIGFEWEHHVRARETGACYGPSHLLHMFNDYNTGNGQGVNGSFGNGVNQTTGLEFFLDYTTMTAELTRNLYDTSDPLYVQTQGSYLPLSNGNTIMGYGQVPKIMEYGPDGDVRLHIQFGYMDANVTTISYRSFKYEWNAIPAADPKAVGENGVAYMSWNGATNVSSWEIWEGTAKDSLKKTKLVPSTGFETNSTLEKETTWIQCVALVGEDVKRKSNVAEVETKVVVQPLEEYGIVPGAETYLEQQM